MRIDGSCSICRSPIAVEASGIFVAAVLVGGTCRHCADQQLQAEGGVVLTLRQELPDARFCLGRITVTAGGVKALSEAGQHVIEFLLRHVQGDWGEFGHANKIDLTEEELRRGFEVTDDSGKINTSNLRNNRGEVLSEFQTKNQVRLWIMTRLDAGDDTSVFLPEEY